MELGSISTFYLHNLKIKSISNRLVLFLMFEENVLYIMSPEKWWFMDITVRFYKIEFATKHFIHNNILNSFIIVIIFGTELILRLSYIFSRDMAVFWPSADWLFNNIFSSSFYIDTKLRISKKHLRIFTFCRFTL